MAAVGVAACRIAAAAARTVSSRSFASVVSSVTSSTPDSGDVAHPAADGVDRARLVGELHHQLVDRHTRLALEHLEPDDVALHGADLRRHGTEHTGRVRQPDPHLCQHGDTCARFGGGGSMHPRHAHHDTACVFSALPA